MSEQQHKPNSNHEPGKDPKGPPPPPPNRMGRGLFSWAIILLVVAMLAITFQNMSSSGEKLKTWAEFVNLYEDGMIEPDSVMLRSNKITAIRVESEADGGSAPVYFPISAGKEKFYAEKVDQLTGGQFADQGSPPTWQIILFSPLLLTILLIAVFWFIIARGMRSAGGGAGMLGSFGRSRHRILQKDATNVTFKDVAGVEEAKDEVHEIVQFLKNPKKFTRLGGRIPRGVLLVGSPGTGKTLLAKAIAGEADVPFFSISGSDFVEMFVGVGASRVRDLFKQAKENAPCIIFLDEIDAVGRRRGGGFSSGGNDEREQTLNAILVEMDGFESNDQVIVIAATNRADVLDKALTRPGRFDRQITVPLPDVKGRLQILNVHAKKIKLGPDVDMEKIARGTPMFAGADLAALINEAAIGATLSEKEFVEHDDLEEARDKVKFGRARKSRVIEEEERVATAYHEAGHAVLQVILPNTDPLHKVTIIPRGEFGGASMTLPEKDRYGYASKWLRSHMAVACGGRIAEEIKTSDISSGAASDIQQVTNIARTMVTEWGMSPRLGFVRFSGEDNPDMFVPEREYSDETAQVVDEEIKRLADEAYELATTTLKENWDKVVVLAEALLKHETLDADDVNALMRGEQISTPTVSDLLEAEAKKSPQAPAEARAQDDEEEGPATGMLPSPA
ncbi:MAG: ATP-dependent zinc metalloprotease FtsH [Phycisphaerales bacterium JB043]